jgi:diketogulonate reductase-like aldo/keto reductase
MNNVPTVTLSDGNQIPMLGFGLGTAHFAGDAVDPTVMALRNGYYHLDTAECYMNEEGVGAGIKAAGVSRESLYITAKVVGTIDQDVEAALATTLSKLGVDYVDLYLVHVPFSAGSPEGLQKIWAQMEAVKKTGKVKSIGVSNFEKEDLEIIFQKATVRPVINQIELHPYQQHGDLLDFHRQHNITTAAYSTLSAITAARPGSVDGVHAELAKKYGVSESEIGLRWALDQGVVTITTSKNEQRLQTYSKSLFSFKLTQEEIQQISHLGREKTYQTLGMAYMTQTYGNYKVAQK